MAHIALSEVSPKQVAETQDQLRNPASFLSTKFYTGHQDWTSELSVFFHMNLCTMHCFIEGMITFDQNADIKRSWELSKSKTLLLECLPDYRVNLTILQYSTAF